MPTNPTKAQRREAVRAMKHAIGEMERALKCCREYPTPPEFAVLEAVPCLVAELRAARVEVEHLRAERDAAIAGNERLADKINAELY